MAKNVYFDNKYLILKNVTTTYKGFGCWVETGMQYSGNFVLYRKIR